MKEWSKETILAHAGTCWDEKTGAVSMPVYQTATFSHPGLGKSTGYDYSRSGNPNRTALEEIMAVMDNGARALAFSSGMAAIDCFMKLFRPGDTLIVTEDPYGGTFRLLEKVYTPMGIKIIYVDTSSNNEVEKAFNPDVRAIFVETPTNPLLRIADIPGIARMAKKRGILTIVDNTFLPYWQHPLELGADIVIYSATKFLSGHNDVLAGIIVAADNTLVEKLYFYQNSTGAVLGPWDSWLIMRGLKTLPLRLERQEKNALEIAHWLTGHSKVTKVFYPGLPDHPGHALLKKQSGGFGAVISFEVDDPGIVPVILSRVKGFLFAESLGGVESLITFPAVQTHSDVDPEIRLRLGINDRLLRLSVGVEAVNDLTDDLAQAIDNA